MHTTSITLLNQVQQGDKAAWDRFHSLYAPLLLRWGQKSGLSLDEAGELVQEIFLLLTREMPKFRYDATRGNFRSWLKTVTINKHREMRRRRAIALGAGSSDALLDGILADDELEASWDVEYNKHVVRRALEIMQEQFELNTWKACWEVTVEERPAAEVAAELGISVASVYVSKSRVLRRLRQELAGLLD